MEVEPRRHAAHVAQLLRGDECDAGAGPARTCRAAHPMDVALVVFRRVVVHDQRDPLEVEPSRGHVGRDEDADESLFEPMQGVLPRLLRHVAVHRDDRYALGAELPREMVDRPLRVHEHERRSLRLRRQPGERQELLLRRDRDEPVVGFLDEPQLPVVDLVPHGVARVHVRHPADRAVERRGEEHRLPILREPSHDPIDLRLESHVEHPVGLVRARGSRRRPGGRARAPPGRRAAPAWRSGCAPTRPLWTAHAPSSRRTPP